MFKAKISIIIPLGYLDDSFHKTLKVALEQTLTPYELLVIDSSKNKKISSIINSFIFGKSQPGPRSPRLARGGLDLGRSPSPAST